MGKRPRIADKLLNLASPLAFLAVWELASVSGFVPKFLFPPPSSIFSRIFTMFLTGGLLRDSGLSLMRITTGLAAGTLLGVFLGLLAGRMKLFRRMIHPIVSLSYPVPKIAIIPFLILFFGIGETSKIVLIGLGGFFLVYLSTLHGVMCIDPRYFDAARIFSLSRTDTWTKIVLPATLPSIFNGIKLATGMCFILVVASEFIGGSSGIGYRIWNSWENFDVTGMFAALFVISFLGWIFGEVVDLTAKACMPWRRS
ncbi:MAG: ABC transporter permease [Candidatus Omnitrophica bacterium]|nr:ABC transporter permease [Candidatus Omnitrophota bacterium]MDD4013775.1 ABC transporter permease [Candidatus Omnitrophota bacterium]